MDLFMIPPSRLLFDRRLMMHSARREAVKGAAR
jgi:hypothetical protein